MGNIGVLYILLVFKETLPLAAIVVMITLGLSMTTFMCLMLGMGSQSISKSVKILQRVKYCNTESRSKSALKMFKSCPKIVIRVGAFHKIDKKRVPSLIRFILQRTFFLVIKTKLSIGSSDTNLVY